MPKFAAVFQKSALSSASVGAIGAVNTTQVRRGRIYDVTFGSEDTPAEAAIRWMLQRYTAFGTQGSGVTPKPLDMADSAFLGQAGQAHSAEPTYTAGEVMLDEPVNQRATYRWLTLPENGIVWPATTANGLGIKTPTISTGNPKGTVRMHVEE